MPKHAQPVTNIARHLSLPATPPRRNAKNAKLPNEPNTPQTGEEEIHP